LEYVYGLFSNFIISCGVGGIEDFGNCNFRKINYKNENFIINSNKIKLINKKIIQKFLVRIKNL